MDERATPVLRHRDEDTLNPSAPPLDTPKRRELPSPSLSSLLTIRYNHANRAFTCLNFPLTRLPSPVRESLSSPSRFSLLTYTNSLSYTAPTMKQKTTKKNPHAVALGRLGGRKGGKARWAGLTPEERSEVARNAVLARWAKVKKANKGKKRKKGG